MSDSWVPHHSGQGLDGAIEVLYACCFAHDREHVLHGPALAHPHPIESSLYVKRRFGRWVKRPRVV